MQYNRTRTRIVPGAKTCHEFISRSKYPFAGILKLVQQDYSKMAEITGAHTEHLLQMPVFSKKRDDE